MVGCHSSSPAFRFQPIGGEPGSHGHPHLIGVGDKNTDSYVHLMRRAIATATAPAAPPATAPTTPELTSTSNRARQTDEDQCDDYADQSPGKHVSREVSGRHSSSPVAAGLTMEPQSLGLRRWSIIEPMAIAISPIAKNVA